MQLTIEKLIYGGDGLARLPADEHGRGKAVFLPFVLQGENVEASLVEQKAGFARARVNAIVEPSPHRIQPKCPYFGRCGGCHYQHASYEHQLEIKAAVLKENLRRIAKLELESEPILHRSPEWNYRNRTRLKVQNAPEFAIGYYKANSHELLPVEECPISSPLINRAIGAFWRIGRQQQDIGGIEEIEFFANSEDSLMLIEASCSPSVDRSSANQIAQVLKGLLPEVAGVTLFPGNPPTRAAEPKPIAGTGASDLIYKTAAAEYRVSAGSFFQGNRFLIDKLVALVTEQRSGETALDLYAGVGLFSTVLARSFAQIISVEPSPTSHADLLYNSFSNVKAVRETTEQFLKTVAGTLRPDFVVVDPPRSGLGEMVVRGLASLGASRITYVSCDPATASRDLAGLLAAGYGIQQAHVVDLFPQTFHVESVFHLVVQSLLGR